MRGTGNGVRIQIQGEVYTTSGNERGKHSTEWTDRSDQLSRLQVEQYVKVRSKYWAQRKVNHVGFRGVMDDIRPGWSRQQTRVREEAESKHDGTDGRTLLVHDSGIASIDDTGSI